jgi:hypothetical protein
MFPCSECSKMYTRRYDLQRHKRDKHPQHMLGDTTKSNQNTAKTQSPPQISSLGTKTPPPPPHTITCDKTVFLSPTTISISGISGSGKTSILFKILDNKEELFDIKPNKIMYCYGAWQSSFENKDGEIDFHEGVPSSSDIEEFVDGKHNIIILDDLQDQVVQDIQVQHLFTRGSHHNNLTIININQNMFAQGKHARNINVNTHYMILTRNPRDVTQVNVLARQTGLGQTLIEGFRDSTAHPYGYILINLSPHSDQQFRVMSNIFPDEDRIVYMSS